MRTIKVSPGIYYHPMSRQHKRVLAYLLFGVLTFGVYYVWSAQPIDPLAVPFAAHEAYMNGQSSKQYTKSQHSYDWRKAPFVNKIQTYFMLPTGKPRTLPSVQFENFHESRSQRNEREARRTAVRHEFQHTWDSYKEFAWAQDELKPTTASALESFGGWGATLVDSLDTLWIMGMKDDFDEAVETIAAIDFGKTEVKVISVFETTIRYLGGLISAYDLSLRPVLLEKAVQLGEMLYRAFDTPNHTPLGWLDIENTKITERGRFDAEQSMCLACLGSFTIEFTRLSQITSQPKYFDLVARISALLNRTQDSTKLPGLWPTMVNPANEQFDQSRVYSIGALADSTYEYFPKMYALLGGLEPVYEKLYNKSAAMIDKHMLFRPMVKEPDLGQDLLFCGDVLAFGKDEIKLEPQMQHLTCFVGGMFALAGRLFDHPEHVDIGAKLTNGCIFAYAQMPTGIMPESFEMAPCESRTSCSWNETAWEERLLIHYRSKYVEDTDSTVQRYRIPPGFTYLRDKRYLLRPEAIESVFIMYRITGDPKYLDAAWDMFTSIVAASRTPYANGQVLDVTFVPPSPGHRGNSDVREGVPTREENIEDKMESFWTAETLKYFYLIFSTPDMISLDDWVFNTEAHPFRRPRMTRVQDGA